MCRSNIKDDYFEYNELFKNFESKKIESVINSLRQPFADIAKNLDITTNTQWIVRTYLASKMILASSVMLTSAEYAESKNLRIVNPYLMYYPLLSCARAVVFTNPYQEWSDDLIAMNHSKTINKVILYQDMIRQRVNILSLSLINQEYIEKSIRINSPQMG